MIALVAGALLASLALAFVLYPLFDEKTLAAPTRRRRTAPVLSAPDAVAALREIEFDRATGKLSDGDYEALKATYTRQALAEMRAKEASAPPASAPAAAPDLDPVEALIRRQRALVPTCTVHGPRPETDAVFCSDCGRYLGHACPDCGREIREPDARFCSDCGLPLAA